MHAARPASWGARSALLVAATLLAIVGASSGGPAVAQSDQDDQDALAYPLEGTRWRLTEYRYAGEARPPGPEVHAWIRLRDGALSGSTGCGRLRGEYAVGEAAIPPEQDEATASPDPSAAPSSAAPSSPPVGLMDEARIRFEVPSGGRQDCAEQTMLVVGGLLDGLAEAASQRLEPGSPPWRTELVLLDGEGQPVLRSRVDDVGSLTGTTWLLDSVDGEPALTGSDEQPAVLAFDAGRDARPGDVSGGPLPLTGSTGCDAFSGTYALTGSVLSIGDLETTEDPCTPALATQEVALLDILESSSLTVSLPPGALELRSDDDGRTLRYRATAALEDQQWVLERPSTRRLGTTDTVVTLFLVPDPASADQDVSRGTITGEGPCRPYSGTYRTDGLRVVFETVEPDDVPCATPRAERGYVRALRDAVFGEVDGGVLRLRDGQGGELLRFATPSLP